MGGLADAGKLGERDPEEAVRVYLLAAEAGILKVMSKMGISAVSSYHGAQIFEALGLGDEVTQRSFPGTTSRVGGIGFREIAEDVRERHQRAFSGEVLERGGWYKYRRDSDYHANEPPVWRALHAVVQGGGREEYRAYSELVHSRPPAALRDLLEFATDREPIDIERVESVDQVLSRFQTGAMSLGALSSEAHEDVARAMNRIGGLANTGEGGEDPRRYAPDGDKRDANSHIKQVASGRFGVTPAYLAGARQLDIKMAQGSKPGEGGQLPGHKVTPYIASLRHVLPGTPLISPPPHHDIYSIEDLAQLIYDLKTANPKAKVGVKLVASEGVGTIAAGVAKAYADTIPDQWRGRWYGRLATVVGQVRGEPLGGRPGGNAADLGHEWTPGARDIGRRRWTPHRARRRHGRPPGGGCVWLWHDCVDGHRVQDGATVPYQHLPGGDRHAG